MRIAMRLLSLAVLPVALTIASASLGAGWESGMQEDEGGPVMMAWVYGAESGAVPAELRMFCGDEVSLRYGQGAIAEGSDPVREPVTFTFDFGDDILTLDMQYEEMDGMYAAYLEPDALLIGFLRSKDSVAVDAPTGPWPVQEFSLEGSSRAISAVLRSCN
jgi:hypothetical protein